MEYAAALDPTYVDPEELKRRLAMPAPRMSANDAAPAPEASASAPEYAYPESPAISASDLGASDKRPSLSEAMLGTQQQEPQPKWSDYAPAEKHGLSKVGSILAGFLEPTDKVINRDPQTRAANQYTAASNEWNARRANEFKAAELDQKPELAEMQGELRGATAANVAKIGAQSRETVAQTGATSREGVAKTGAESRETVAKTGADSREAVEKERAQSAENIAKMRTESAERVATAHDLTSKEVAKIRGELANDPNKLTVTMKTMKQQAQATLPQIDKAMDETEKVAAMLGPTEGRWNDFLQGKIGAPDPQFAHYRDNIHMVSTAVTLAHARGRMSNELYESFQKMFDAGSQSAENMMQALNVAKDWLGEYANMGEVGSPVGNAPAVSAPAAKATIPTFAEHQAAKQKKP